MSIKYVSLAALAMQNSALALTMRYSRTQSGPRYIPTTAVVVSELLKSVLSVAILLLTRWKAKTTSTVQLPLSTKPVNDQKRSRSLALGCLDDILRADAVTSVTVAAILYAIQNNLQYLAATNLNAATFQILYQGKILTTALFAVLILQQRLSGIKWAAIITLTAGIMLVLYPAGASVEAPGIGRQREGRLLGLMAVLATCILSGYTGIYLEFIFKNPKNGEHSGIKPQLWVQNVQLSTISVVVALLGAALVDGRQILSNGVFYGYNKMVLLTILLQAVGGLVVSVVVTYADSILKGFATSFSLVGSTAVSAIIGDTILTRQLALGCALVILATNVYGLAFSENKTLAGDFSDNVEVKIASRTQELGSSYC